MGQGKQKQARGREAQSRCHIRREVQGKTDGKAFAKPTKTLLRRGAKIRRIISSITIPKKGERWLNAKPPKVLYIVDRGVRIGRAGAESGGGSGFFRMSSSRGTITFERTKDRGPLHVEGKERRPIFRKIKKQPLEGGFLRASRDHCKVRGGILWMDGGKKPYAREKRVSIGEGEKKPRLGVVN